MIRTHKHLLQDFRLAKFMTSIDHLDTALALIKVSGSGIPEGNLLFRIISLLLGVGSTMNDRHDLQYLNSMRYPEMKRRKIEQINNYILSIYLVSSTVSSGGRPLFDVYQTSQVYSINKAARNRTDC